MSPERILMWIGVASSIGCVFLVLAFLDVFQHVEKLCKRTKDTIGRWRAACFKHGIRRGIRYRLGLRLLWPYLEARWKEIRVPDLADRPPAEDTSGRVFFDHRRTVRSAQRREIAHWVHLDGGGERD